MKIATHNGPFHADDLLATALLLSIYPEAEVIRSRDKDELDSCDIVYDVGGEYDVERGRFDHHMHDFAEIHENGLTLSSLGLLWREYGEQFCESAEVAELLRQRLVMAIDGPDNGQSLYDVTEYDVSPINLQTVFKSCYPAYGEEEDFDQAFFDTLPLAQKILNRFKAKYTGVVKARDEFLNAYKASPDPRYVFLDKGMPFGEEAQNLEDLLYVCFPINDGKKYMIRAVSSKEDSFAVRKPFPETWAGLEGKDLEDATGIADAEFCHKALWLCGANTKEAAQAMIDASLAT